jgi:cell fate regulator YaaT (PSP1 superfamily)
MMEEQNADEDQEPNLAFSDDDRIDFQQLRRDLTPAQRLRLEEIQRET